MYTFVIPIRSSIISMFVNMPHIKYTRTFNFVDNILLFVLYIIHEWQSIIVNSLKYDGFAYYDQPYSHYLHS